MFCFIRRLGPPFIHGLRHSESPCHAFSSVFRAITSQYQRSKPSSSHFQFWRSEPSLSHSRFRRSKPSPLPSLTFMVAFPISAFRAIIITSQFGVQSHHRSQFRRSEPSSSLLSFWRSESSSLLSFGIQSHHCFSVLAFRAITIFSLAFRAVITSQFGVQSHHHSRFGGS